MYFRYVGSGEDRVTEKMTAFGMERERGGVT